MLRWLIFIQAIVYLLIVPLLRAASELGYKPPMLASAVALTALAAGGFLFPLNRSSLHPALPYKGRIGPASWLWAGWLLLAVAYAILVLQYGLLDRRQGSEVMAELYAGLPLPVLAIIRVYELLLVPVIIIYLFSGKSTPRWQRNIVIVVVLLSIPFLGLSDSRSRLIVLAMSILSFMTTRSVIKQLYSNAKLVAGIGVVGVFFSIVSSQRAEKYGSVSDFLFSEVYVRLDGLNLVGKLKDAGLLSWWGSFDFAMVGPLLSKIPFLEAARTAKLLGRTSTKQYVIRDLLRSNSFDDSNSMILDPLYFGGLVGLFIGFVLMMWGARAFDRYVAEDKLLTNKLGTGFAMTFATGIVVFENDWLGSFANMGLTFILISGLLVLCTNKIESSSFLERNVL
jgi:hypothetical protein